MCDCSLLRLCPDACAGIPLDVDATRTASGRSGSAFGIDAKAGLGAQSIVLEREVKNGSN